METNEVGTALKAVAQQWSTPRFDAASLAAQSDARRKQSRRRWGGATLAGAVLVAALTGAVLSRSDRRPADTRPVAAPTHTIARPRCCNMAPGNPPELEIDPLESLGTIGGQHVLARAQAGQSVTLQARLSFPIARTRQPVEAATLVVALPGTALGTGGSNYDSYYAATRVAEGQPVTATAPETRVLKVTTPTNLRAGTYPVFSVVRAGLASGQQPGIDGPFDMSWQVGVIVLTAP